MFLCTSQLKTYCIDDNDQIVRPNVHEYFEECHKTRANKASFLGQIEEASIKMKAKSRITIKRTSGNQTYRSTCMRVVNTCTHTHMNFCTGYHILHEWCNTVSIQAHTFPFLSFDLWCSEEGGNVETEIVDVHLLPLEGFDTTTLTVTQSATPITEKTTAITIRERYRICSLFNLIMTARG